jgi:sterol desaturase/sphingolipid hydroxylase (fatty acid hydroxylase superfamily)
VGMMLQYLRYDTCHFLIHSRTPKQLQSIPLVGDYLYACAVHHRSHHYINPRTNFTISFTSRFFK